MITLFELAEYNVYKKNYSKPLLIINKDVRAFLRVQQMFMFLYYHNEHFSKSSQPFFFFLCMRV